ncbi:MAG: hypothetical protein C0601_02080 [Candidatus Muiribacterium halophilum]|uniref:Uncharacterized protein n=1 Tax=Muiribacterium halophilum TaxID=2053465 RepID=A0A2N5ZL35_MUIH1|nr:MAG: hypothetical protein C0601_02080 [Candidatus Muirbacterium halophilum]
MIWILYEKKYKHFVEPYILALFSSSRKKIGLVPLEREYLLDKSKEDVMRFPEDFTNINTEELELNRFDYSILPDHGIENAYHANVFSQERKGRLYLDTSNVKDTSLPEIYNRLPVIKRTKNDILNDMHEMEKRFFVKNFIVYTDNPENIQIENFKDLYKVEVKTN